MRRLLEWGRGMRTALQQESEETARLREEKRLLLKSLQRARVWYCDLERGEPCACDDGPCRPCMRCWMCERDCRCSDVHKCI